MYDSDISETEINAVDITYSDEAIEFQGFESGYLTYDLDYSSSSDAATIGFAATRYGQKGYVTAAHIIRYMFDTVSYSTNSLGTVWALGTCTDRVLYGNCDASFIEINQGLTLNNEIVNDREITSTSTYNLPINTSIEKYGKATSTQTGTIVDNDAFFYGPPTLSYMTKKQATSSIGDSGGPVYRVTSGNSVQLIGITSAGKVVNKFFWF